MGAIKGGIGGGVDFGVRGWILGGDWGVALRANKGSIGGGFGGVGVGLGAIRVALGLGVDLGGGGVIGGR